MGRPEKAAPREMKPAAHAIFPLGTHGGPQKLMGVAASQENLRINLVQENVLLVANYRHL